MFCYPKTIKNLSYYKDFVAEIKAIESSGLTYYCKYKDRKKVAKKYGIAIIPQSCNNKCPYKKECDKECVELRKII